MSLQNEIALKNQVFLTTFEGKVLEINISDTLSYFFNFSIFPSPTFFDWILGLTGCTQDNPLRLIRKWRPTHFIPWLNQYLRFCSPTPKGLRSDLMSEISFCNWRSFFGVFCSSTFCFRSNGLKVSFYINFRGQCLLEKVLGHRIWSSLTWLGTFLFAFLRFSFPLRYFHQESQEWGIFALHFCLPC